MKRSITTFSSFAMLLGALALASQAKPNFAGKWTMVPDANAPAAGGMFAASAMTAVQDDKTLTVTVTGQMGEVKTTYNLDGTEGKSPLEFNGTTIDRVTKAAWEGSKLVLTTTSNFNGQSFETKQVWSLGADGGLVVESTRPDFQGGGAPITTKLTYKKS